MDLKRKSGKNNARIYMSKQYETSTGNTSQTRIQFTRAHKDVPGLHFRRREIIRVNRLQDWMFGEDLKDEDSGGFMPGIHGQEQTGEPKTVGEVVQSEENGQEALQRQPMTRREIDRLDVTMTR